MVSEISVCGQLAMLHMVVGAHIVEESCSLVHLIAAAKQRKRKMPISPLKARPNDLTFSHYAPPPKGSTTFQ